MNIAPGAVVRLVANKSTPPPSPELGLVLHVQAGNNSPFGWFNNTTSQASSTWWVAKSGILEQYVDPDKHHAWAQAAGNRSYHSVETEGYPTEALTEQQVNTLAVLYAWGYLTRGWPLQLANAVGDRGLAWHGMGATAWGGHPACPGDLRKAQRQRILDLAAGIVRGPSTPSTGGFLVALTDAQQQALYDALLKPRKSIVPGSTVSLTPLDAAMNADGYSYLVHQQVIAMQNQITALQATVTAQAAGVAALAKAQGLDPATIQTTVSTAVAKALDGLALKIQQA